MSKLDDTLSEYDIIPESDDAWPEYLYFQLKKDLCDVFVSIVDDLENHYAYYLNQEVGKKRAKFADELRRRVVDL